MDDSSSVLQIAFARGYVSRPCNMCNNGVTLPQKALFGTVGAGNKCNQCGGAGRLWALPGSKEILTDDQILSMGMPPR
jgi:hypothetical protein